MTQNGQQRAYTMPYGLSARAPKPVVANRAPTTTDLGYDLGTLWVNPTTELVYSLASTIGGSATWLTFSNTESDVNTLTGDTGGAISPVSNNIDLLGTASQIETAGAGDAITFSIADPFVPTGDVEINGTLDVTGLTTLAALTQVGTASINATGAATTTIGSASAGAIVIDTTAGVTITADEASSFTVTDASADLTLASTLGSVNITAGQSAADSIVISSTIGGIDITAAGAAAGEDIDITATGSSINLVSTEAAVANAIRLNASAADGGIDIDAGTGGITVDSTGAFSIDGAAASNVTTTGAGIDLTLSSVLGSVKINSTEDAAGAIALSANGGTSETITVVASQGTGAASVALTSTAGGVTITGGLATADAVNIVSSNVGGGIDIDAGTAGIAIDSTGAFSIDGAAASNVTVTGAGIDLTLASVLGSVKINSTEDAAGAIALSANGGTSETITVTASQGTGAASISLSSTAGGVTIAGGLATADAINLAAAAGGVDIDGALQVNIASSQDAADAVRIVASAGGIDIDAVGAADQDIVITNTGGSVAIVSTEAVATAINLTASDAGGGITFTAGTGNVNVAGNLALTSVATKILMNGGAVTDFIGTGTLNNGVLAVANTNIATGDVILLTRTAANASSALGMLTYAIVNATSFTVTALETATPADTEVGDQSSFAYVIFRPT